MVSGLRALIICACLITGLTGCQSENTFDKSITLQTASMFGGADESAVYYKNLIEQFQQQNIDVVIEDNSDESTESWKENILQRFESGETTPDVLIYFTGADARELIFDNQFVPIDEIQEKYPEYAANIRESAIEFMRELDGEYYCVPVRGFWEGLYCNQDIFNRYGLALPDDWESFECAIKTFRQNGVTPIAVSFSDVPHYWIEHMILSIGGVSEHELNPVGFIPESWVDAMAELKRIYDIGAFNDNCMDINNADAITMFTDKKAAMLLDGSWSLSAISSKNSTVVLPFPAFSNEKKDRTDIISGYSTGVYISRNAWDDPIKQEAAVRFASYLTSNDSIAYLCQAGGMPSAEVPITSEDNQLYSSVVDIQKNAAHMVMPIDAKLYKDSWQHFCMLIPKLLEGEISPEALIENVTDLNRT